MTPRSAAALIRRVMVCGAASFIACPHLGYYVRVCGNAFFLKNILLLAVRIRTFDGALLPLLVNFDSFTVLVHPLICSNTPGCT
jgi:hypothetical protein